MPEGAARNAELRGESMRQHDKIGGCLLVAAIIGASGVAAAQTTRAGLAGYLSTEPRYGTPNSMQFQATSTALDLTTIDDEPAADGTLPTGDADTIGGAFTYFKAGLQEGQRYEARYQHQRRLREGSRARLLIDIPIDVVHANRFLFAGVIPFGGATAVYGTISGGVELPVKPNWLITPRLAYSNLQAGQYFSGDGELATGSITSRYKIAQLGRGDLTIGNMAAYTRTIRTFLAKQPFFSVTTNYVLRNGLAYQLPLKSRFMGRQSSVRASYVFTYTGGSQGLAYRNLHEVALNMGVRTREAEQKNSFEQIRLGVLYTHGVSEFDSKSGYDSFTFTAGYRF